VKYSLVIYIFLVTISSNILAQYYDTGQDPASLKWMQIKTNRFTVIYPDSYSSEGVKFAESLDNSYAKLTSLYSVKKVRIPVIIHNYTTFSNGYVAWAPKRMEIFPTPEQNGIPMDPVEQLTTHELTHVLQMVSLNKGFSKGMSVLFGEQFTGAVSALLPLWFMEGEAVLAESLFSQSGRGKTPSFQKQMKAISLENPKMYSYDKILAGSFKDFIPDHYQYGYQMIAWSYSKYSPLLWNKTLDYTAKRPYTINPVNLSLSINAGLTKSKLFSETFDSLYTIWQGEELKINPANYKSLNPKKKKDYVNYYSPVIIGRDSVIAIKTSFSSPAEFVLINLSDKSEKKIHTPGSMYPYSLSGSNGKIVWVENRPDPRWENRTFSVIKIMDLHKQITRQLSFKSRYLAASVSFDGKYIATVENTVRNENSLIILDALSGNVLNKIPVPANAYPQRPQWSQTGSEILVVLLSGKGEGIMSYSIKNQTWNTLINPGRDDLQSAFLRNDSLFYVSSSSGTDNIYILTSDKKITKLTNSRYGAYDPFPVGNNVVFSDYSSSGYNICEVCIKEAADFSNNVGKDPSFLINRFDSIKINDTDESLIRYKPEPYKKLSHLFRFHSWMPFYADIEKIKSEPGSVRPGITIMSQNQLSTLISTISYEYTADKKNLLHSRITWKGWYPVIESQLDYGGNPEIVKTKSNDPDPSVVFRGLNFTNIIYLPLTFSLGKFSQYIQPSIAASYRNNYIYIPENELYDYGQTQVTSRVYLSNYQISAIRDIYPKWAQVIDYFYTFYPADKALYGNISTLKTAFFFPGIFHNHSLKLRFEDEVQKPVKFILENRASFPRGYKNIISQNLKFYSADYTMPLWFPDINLPGLVFLKRIRSGIFYDYATGTKNSYFYPTGRVDHNYTETFKSFGGELLADYYLLRIPFMISSGVQAAWKNFSSYPSVEIVFNIDIFGMKIGKNRL
jgi:hypothetical protein